MSSTKNISFILTQWTATKNSQQSRAPISRMNPFIKNVPRQIQRKCPPLVGATVVVSIGPELMENERFSHRGSKAFFFAFC